MRQPKQKGCLSYKKHTLRTQGATEVNDNSNEREFFNVPLVARSYGGVDLGLKSIWKKPGIKLMTPGWRGAQLYHYTTEAPFPNISTC